MQRFSYVAMDGNGKETQGVIEAASQAQAIAMIRSQGMFPTRIGPAGAGGGAPARKGGGGAAKKSGGMNAEIKLPKFMQPRVKPKDLMVLTRQLATLVDAGLPLLRGLRILLNQTKHPALREALSGMGEAVEGGSTFSEALAQYPKVFDNLYVNMVKAGEAGGVLEVVLNRLAEFMEKAQKIKNKIKSAMTYPVVVMIAAVGILTFLLIKVIPQFENIFKDLLLDALPPITRFVIGASNVVKDNSLLVGGGIVLLVIAIQLWGRTKGGRMLLDKAQLYAPLFGPLFRKTAIARVTRTLGTLMSSGVPVLQALTIVRDTSGNAVVARALQQVHDSVKEGESMTAPLEASGVFPGMVVSMVDVGEETGALPEMLVRISDNYDDEVDNAVEGLTSIIEPIMIVFLAVIIGTIVIAMFVPLISIIGELSV